ncbi:MAG: hypothetical protein LC131_06340 [Anaerolineae bacterium]|nr:hypothetical protein [Anaerolineae bacterium]
MIGFVIRRPRDIISLAAARTLQTAGGVAGELLVASGDGAIYLSGVADDDGADVAGLLITPDDEPEA